MAHPYDLLAPHLAADASKCSVSERRLLHAGYLPQHFRMDVYAVPGSNPVVVITHMPTGTQASCGESRIQRDNQAEAMNQLATLLTSRNTHTEGR